MDVTLHTVAERFALRFERRLPHAPELVWQALTDPAKFSAWYPFPVVELDLRIGGAIRFDGGDGTPFGGAITDLDPPHDFGFREVDDLLHFALRPDGAGCHFVLTHTFDDREMAPRCAAGWHSCLDALDAVLADRAVVDISEERRAELRESYARRFVADGTVERIDGASRVRFQRRLAHPIERVWSALTDPQQLLGWLGAAEIDLVEGGRFDLRWLNTDERGEPFTMHATITRLQPPHLLETSGDAHGVLRWELQPDGAGTLLTFSSTLDFPEEYRTRVLAGWHYHLDALATALNGGSVDLVHLPNARWETIHAQYA
jgi:uncharacterized protein YndB with AHSA1/START domain